MNRRTLPFTCRDCLYYYSLLLIYIHFSIPILSLSWEIVIITSLYLCEDFQWLMPNPCLINNLPLNESIHPNIWWKVMRTSRNVFDAHTLAQAAPHTHHIPTWQRHQVIWPLPTPHAARRSSSFPIVATDIHRHRSGCRGFVEGVMFIDRYAGLGVKEKVNLFTRCQEFHPLLWLHGAQSIAHYCSSSRSTEGKENKGNFPGEESAS